VVTAMDTLLQFEDGADTPLRVLRKVKRRSI
jgi:hypothetical protein